MREPRRRSAIEPIIGHLKAEGHLGRCFLKGRPGHAANFVLSAVGHNFRRILAWLRHFWRDRTRRCDQRPVGLRSAS
jgi:transposase, IS5 family